MLDIRMPIGLLFSILGVLVLIYGLVTMSDTAMYNLSLGININIWSGVGMSIFGGIMLYFALKAKKKEA
jgi:hypothetical protein